MTKYYWDGSDWKKKPPRRPRKRLMIISDTAEPFKSMADGQVYDSKSRYYRSLKEGDFEIVGNEYHEPVPLEPQGVDQAVKDAVEQIEAGKGASRLGTYPQEWEDD